MYPNIEDDASFRKRVETNCEQILQAISGEAPDTLLFSVDEKTSIQALERVAKGESMKQGQPARREYEYDRNGSTCLMAAINVGNSELNHYRLHPTRTEKDFLIFIQEIVAQCPSDKQIVFMADQLNTHKSVSLVRWIAKEIGFTEDLGVIYRRGILKNMASRQAFLESVEHRIRFSFTPKHCSWLNPIENWFGKLERHVIKRGNFSCVEDLECKIIRYIEFYNQCLRKPIKWKFKGFYKDKEVPHRKRENELSS